MRVSISSLIAYLIRTETRYSSKKILALYIYESRTQNTFGSVASTTSAASAVVPNLDLT